MGYDKRQTMVAGRFPQVGAIFMCNSDTKKECFRRKLFGLPSGKAEFVERIKAGMILFLFEYERRELHGVFQACSDGAMDIVPHAYTDSGTQFSAQVKFTTILRCSPLSEDEFSGAIRENYFAPYKFNFGLSERQVENLLQLFSSRKLGRQLHHRQSPQNNVRRSSTPNYPSSPPKGSYSNLGVERYQQNAVPGSGSVRSPEYSESATDFIRRAIDEYASTTVGNDLRLNDRYHVPVTPNENLGDLSLSNNVALERPVQQDNWRSTVGHLRNEINADFVHRMDGRSRYSDPILATDRRTGSRSTGYDPLVPSEQQLGVSQYRNPPMHGKNSIYETNSLVGDDLQHTSTDRRTGSSAPGYDQPVSSEQQRGVSQYPNPPVYGSNSVLGAKSLAGDDLQHTSSIMHRSSAERGHPPLQPYSALSDLEAMPRPSLISNGPYTVASSRTGTGIASIQPYNPEAPSYNDTNHSLSLLRVSSSFPDDGHITLNDAAYHPSYENELLQPYRQLRDDSSLLPRCAHSKLSSDNNEDSYRSNMLDQSSLPSEFFFPRPSLPHLPLLSENQSGRNNTAGERSLLAPPVINTPSGSRRRHLVTTSLEGNIPQSGSARDEVPCSRSSIPNSERTHDSRRSKYGTYSPTDLYGGQDSERTYSDQQNRKKRSVFDRVVFPTRQEREHSITDFVGDDDDDKDDFSVSEIMTSLRQSKYQWLEEKEPAKSLNARHNNGARYHVGNNKRQIRPWESKSADDHLAASVEPVEDDDDTPLKIEESTPFVDFKRRRHRNSSSTLDKAHQVEAASTTANDNVVSAENEQPKRRKLIRPKFDDGT